MRWLVVGLSVLYFVSSAFLSNGPLSLELFTLRSEFTFCYLKGNVSPTGRKNTSYYCVPAVSCFAFVLVEMSVFWSKIWILDMDMFLVKKGCLLKHQVMMMEETFNFFLIHGNFWTKQNASGSKIFLLFFFLWKQNTFPLVCLQSDGMDLEITRKIFFFFQKTSFAEGSFQQAPIGANILLTIPWGNLYKTEDLWSMKIF